MITHELIERIEGEATLDFQTDNNGRVEDAQIRFLHFRGMETILTGRSALDALVIAPRVCGICGHSHLIAAVRMVENAYASAGYPVSITPKADALREITRMCELLQNHIKWLYLVMLHESAKLLDEESALSLKALYVTSQINQLCALFSGQWPHSSYALPGGVVCDPTHIEVMQALKILSGVEKFIEDEVLGIPVKEFKTHIKADTLDTLDGDFGTLVRRFDRLGLSDAGKSHGRFLVLGAERIVIEEGNCRSADIGLVSEDESDTFEHGGKTYAKNALYEGKFYETGPLARALASDRESIHTMYRRRGDDALMRITARMEETVHLLTSLRERLASLDLSQSSFIAPHGIENISGEGIGIVEAPRGVLIHRAKLERGKITDYEIITPTQWNLGNGDSQNAGVAQKAMIGTDTVLKASLIFRTFDVCSVCTTH